MSGSEITVGCFDFKYEGVGRFALCNPASQAT
jgi:hypothetical protein